MQDPGKKGKYLGILRDKIIDETWNNVVFNQMKLPVVTFTYIANYYTNLGVVILFELQTSCWISHVFILKKRTNSRICCQSLEKSAR